MMLSNSKVVNTSEDKKKKKYASFRVSREKFNIKL